jgi:Flp pilus assembly protein TadG
MRVIRFSHSDTKRDRSRGERHTTRRRLGQSLVEFALVLPVLLFMVVIAIDFGRLFFSFVQIHNAAREAANYAASAPTDTAGITDRATAEHNVQGQRGEGSLTVATTCRNSAGTTIACSDASAGAGPGNTVTVSVDEPFTFLTLKIAAFFNNNLHVTASATAAVLGYVPGVNASQPPACTGPTAAFNVIITAGLTIFADPTGSSPNSGVCNISGYNWDWGDTTTTVGTATGDAHTYTAPGTYQITLQVTNQGGTSSVIHPVTVPLATPSPTPTPTPTPTPGPTATPTPTPTASPTPTPNCTRPTANFSWTKSGKTYTYTDLSTVTNPVSCPITDWLWTFTDVGTSSNAQNPNPITYGNNSSHPVTLRVTNFAGSTTITKSG